MLGVCGYGDLGKGMLVFVLEVWVQSLLLMEVVGVDYGVSC